MHAHAFAILAGGWLLWFLPFAVARSRNRTPAAVQLDRRARWGLLLEVAAYSMIWAGPFWWRQPDDTRVAVSVLFFAAGVALAWGATRALGRQWRIDAALNADHDLVRSGPYRFVRHPIYASMLAMLLATGLIIAPWPRFAAALALFLAGTEIRVRVEDRLLESRFGDEALRYRRQVAAYIPFVR